MIDFYYLTVLGVKQQMKIKITGGYNMMQRAHSYLTKGRSGTDDGSGLNSPIRQTLHLQALGEVTQASVSS